MVSSTRLFQGKGNGCNQEDADNKEALLLLYGAAVSQIGPSSTVYRLMTIYDMHDKPLALSSPPFPRRNNRLHQATLIIRHPDDGKLYVNFDQEILQLIREAKILDRMGIEIPESAKIALFQAREGGLFSARISHTVRVVRSSVDTLIRSANILCGVCWQSTEPKKHVPVPGT